MNHPIPKTTSANRWLAAIILSGCVWMSSPPQVQASYQNGIKAIADKNYQKAIVEFEKGAEEGDSRAYNILGNIYFEGAYQQRKNVAEAIDLWKIAAEKGNVEARRNMGLLLLSGQFIPQDEKKAEEYLLEAAKYNDPLALLNLGLLSIKQQKNDVAVTFLLRSAKQGNPRATALLKEMGLKEIPPLPGESTASTQLVKDALLSIVPAAKQHTGHNNCPTDKYFITDTRILSPLRMIEKKGVKFMTATEQWTLSLCEKLVHVPVEFYTKMGENSTSFVVRNGEIK